MAQDIKPTIAVLRTSQGLTPSQLAAKAGISYALLHKMESGEPVSRTFALKVCSALGVNIDDVEGLNIIGKE